MTAFLGHHGLTVPIFVTLIISASLHLVSALPIAMVAAGLVTPSAA